MSNLPDMEEWSWNIRYAISSVLLGETNIQNPFPGRVLCDVMEDIPEASNPKIPIAQCR